MTDDDAAAVRDVVSWLVATRRWMAADLAENGSVRLSPDDVRNLIGGFAATTEAMTDCTRYLLAASFRRPSATVFRRRDYRPEDVEP